MLRAAVPLASVLLVMALQAAAANDAVAKLVTLRVFVIPVTRSTKDVPPKTLGAGEYTKGDTLRGTSVLENPVL